MRWMSCLSCAIALNLFVTGFAAADSVTFSNYSHGQVVADSYSPNNPDEVGTTDGKTVRLEVVNSANPSNDPDLAVIFDSNIYDGDDPDLAGPPDRSWDAGNLAPDTDLGNLLIIQENADWKAKQKHFYIWGWKYSYWDLEWGNRNGNGIVDVGDIVDADDEAGRPAGYVDFFFSESIDTFGFDLVDVEGSVEHNAAYVATFFNIAGDPINSVLFRDFDDFQNDIEWGNNSANRIDSRSISDWTGGQILETMQVRIALGGSGAIDNLNFTYATPTTPPGSSQPIPSPSALLAGLGGLGLMFARRRRNR